MENHLEIVIVKHRGNWFWRIDRNGRTIEDCKDGFDGYTFCAAQAAQAFFKYEQAGVTV